MAASCVLPPRPRPFRSPSFGSPHLGHEDDDADDYNADDDDDDDDFFFERERDIFWRPRRISAAAKDECTMGQNREKHRKNSHLIIHCPTSEEVSEVSERANE